MLCSLYEELLTVSSQGVRVPEVLRKYMPGEIDFIPYTKELPKDSTSNKAKPKGPGPKAGITGAISDAAQKVAGLKV